MKITKLELSYEYSPYRSQEDKEIPAFEIMDQDGEKVADTNENQPATTQEEIAALFTASPRMLRVLEEAAHCREWVHNVAHTDDIEALRRICLHYAMWCNEEALPVIAEAKVGESSNV
jgi:hypothetical protein